MSGRTHGVGPNPLEDALDSGPHREAGGGIDPQAPPFLCPTPPGSTSPYTKVTVRCVAFFWGHSSVRFLVQQGENNVCRHGSHRVLEIL